MEDKKRLLCDRCRNFFPFTEIRYVPQGRDSKVALCAACRARMNVESKDSKQKPYPEKIPFFCIRCRYKFKFDPNGLANLQCPYCGRDDKIVKDKAPSVDNLLRC